MISTIKNTIKYIAREKSHGHVLLFFLIFPIFISTLPFYVTFELSDSGISGNIISGLSLFIGFFFSLIFVISDRVQFKKDELARTTNSTEIDRSRKSKLNEYINFGQQLVGVISTTIYISLALIILILLSEIRIYLDCLPDFNHSYLLIVQTLNLYLGSVLLYFIVHILKEMYDFFYGQIGERSI